MVDVSSQIETLIFGAGLTGLSAAYHLLDPARFRLIEKEAQVGGLAKTRTRPHGFLCDGTGHWLHLQKPEIKSLVEGVMGDNLAPHERRARVFSKGVYTLYPFQANTYGLPKEVVEACLNGLIRARFEEKLPEPTNYKEWIRREFGQGICEHFMFPYNQKIYRVPLETLAKNFAAKYIPRPAVEAVVKGALGLSKEAMGYNARFVYPKKGGIGAISEAIKDRLSRPVEHGRAPKAIDLSAKTVRFEDGETVRFQHLVNTIPLPELIDRCLEGNSQAVPEVVANARQKLRANAVFYFDLAIRGEPKEHQDYHWIYFPEEKYPFYRIGSYSAVERSLAPAGHRSYYVELGHYGAGDPSRYEADVLKGLREIGLLGDERDVLFCIPNILSPAYVLFDHFYEEARGEILKWFDQESPVINVGRYGRWQYNAMEDALFEGKQAAACVLAGQKYTP